MDYRYRDVARDAAKVGSFAVIGGTVAITVIIILAVMWIFGWGFMSQVTAPWRGETEKRELVEASGSFRIAAYEEFFDLCTAVQTKEASIQALMQELATKPSEARTEQINATLTALRSQRAGDIAEYNNNATKDYTVGQFRDSDLPYRLDVNAKETQCAL